MPMSKSITCVGSGRIIMKTMQTSMNASMRSFRLDTICSSLANICIFLRFSRRQPDGRSDSTAPHLSGVPQMATFDRQKFNLPMHQGDCLGASWCMECF
jgi:hypothetical protein